MLYLYALADRLGSVEEIRGVGHEPLVVIDAGPARIVAGQLAAAPACDRATLEAQDRVVRALHDRADALLPMRFGSAADAPAQAIRSVEVIAGGLADRFALVRGREQMTLRVVRAGADVEAAGESGAVPPADTIAAIDVAGRPVDEPLGSGTAYLRARAVRDVPAELLPLVDATRALRRAMRIERGRHDAMVATIYELVDRGASDAYRDLVRAAAGLRPQLTIHVSGPAPAYAFAAG
jgi:hypothetical protein